LSGTGAGFTADDRKDRVTLADVVVQLAQQRVRLVLVAKVGLLSDLEALLAEPVGDGAALGPELARHRGNEDPEVVEPQLDPRALIGPNNATW